MAGDACRSVNFKHLLTPLPFSALRFVKVAVSRYSSNIYVLGETNGGLHSADSSAVDGANAHSEDAFVAVYNSFGTPTKHALIGGKGQNFPVDITMTENDDLIVVVAYTDSDHRFLGDESGYGGDMKMRVYRLKTINIESDDLKSSLNDGGCLAERGCVWMKEFTTDEGSDDYADSDTGMGDGLPTRDVTPTGVAVAKDDNDVEMVYLVGNTSGGGTDFGGDATGSMDGFVLKLKASDGSFVKSKRISSVETDEISSVCVTPRGEPVVVGWTEGSLRTGYKSKGGLDTFVSLLTSSELNTVWTFMDGNENNDFGFGCSVHDTTLYAGGRSRGGVDGIGGWDTVLYKLETNTGTKDWVKVLGSKSDDRMGDIFQTGDVMADEVGNAIMVGMTMGGIGSRQVGNGDIFIRKVTASGEFTRAHEVTAGVGVDGTGGGKSGISKTTEAVLTALGVSIGITMCVVGYFIGKKKTEARYNMLVSDVDNNPFGNNRPGPVGVPAVIDPSDEDMEL